MKIDIINEIKDLNIIILKKLFTIKKDNKNNNKNYPSPLQLRIINYIRKNSNKEISQRDLEKEFNVSKAAISNAVKSMEKKGIIEKNQSLDDARKNILVLSRKSLHLYDEMLDNNNKLNDEIINSLSKDELDEFLRIISKIKTNIRKEDE